MCIRQFILRSRRIYRATLAHAVGAGMFALASCLVPAQTATVRDSVGIKIVSNSARSAAPVAFKLADKPLIRVGGLESDPDLEFDFKSGYMQAIRLSNGGLVVSDKVRLQFFDANSKRVKILGRFGSGPQEFQIAGIMCVTRGDTLVVQDAPNGRLAIVDARAMQFVRTIPTMEFGSLPPRGCLGDGTFLLSKQFGPKSVVEHLYRFRVDGKLVNDYGEFPSPKFEILAPAFLHLNAFGNQFVLASTLSNDLLFYAPNGKLSSVVRSSDPILPMTGANLLRLAERFEASMRAINPNLPAKQFDGKAQVYVQQSALKTVPGHYEVIADGAGGIWVQDYRETKMWVAPWTYFNADGKIVGRLIVPSAPDDPYGARVLGFGPNEIIIKTFDADGASYLSVYPLVRVTAK
ncbi:MAG: hypothetical protein ABJB74_03295 [Gemmatimonas sp.]